MPRLHTVSSARPPSRSAASPINTPRYSAHPHVLWRHVRRVALRVAPTAFRTLAGRSLVHGWQLDSTADSLFHARPQPWLSRSSGSSPSPLNLPSPNGSSSSPSTPTDPIKAFPTRRRSSLEEIDLFDGLADDLDGCAIDSAVQERDRSRDCVELEQVAVLEAKAAGLQPEVDHQGNVSLAP